MNGKYTVYEQQTAKALIRWEKELLRTPGLFEKNVQSGANPD